MIHPCRVVKLGGSFFARDDYAVRLATWLDHQIPMHCVIVTGGGIWADAVRQLDRNYGLSTSASHWMAIRAMSVTSWLLAMGQPELRYIDRFMALRNQLSRRESARLVFDTLHFLQAEEPHQQGKPLPHGWHVTSDSIAARLAQVLDASELVLLKAAPPLSLSAAIRAGTVDTYFQTAAAGIRRIRIEPLE